MVILLLNNKRMGLGTSLYKVCRDENRIAELETWDHSYFEEFSYDTDSLTSILRLPIELLSKSFIAHNKAFIREGIFLKDEDAGIYHYYLVENPEHKIEMDQWIRENSMQENYFVVDSLSTIPQKEEWRYVARKRNNFPVLPHLTFKEVVAFESIAKSVLFMEEIGYMRKNMNNLFYKKYCTGKQDFFEMSADELWWIRKYCLEAEAVAHFTEHFIIPFAEHECMLFVSY